MWSSIFLVSIFWVRSSKIIIIRYLFLDYGLSRYASSIRESKAIKNDSRFERKGRQKDDGTTNPLTVCSVLPVIESTKNVRA